MQNLTHEAQRNLERVAVMYHPYLPRVAALLAVVCAVSAFAYGVLLLEAVAHAGARTAAERSIRELSSSLGVVEGEYLSKAQALTPTRAKELGFVTPTEVSTVYAKGSAGSLSFGEAR